MKNILMKGVVIYLQLFIFEHVVVLYQTFSTTIFNINTNFHTNKVYFFNIL